jgi:prevent-host-death family protein
MNIGAFEAKTHFSKIIRDVESGKVFVITKNGIPVAKLTPINRNENWESLVEKVFAIGGRCFKGKSFDIKAAIERGRK